MRHKLFQVEIHLSILPRVCCLCGKCAFISTLFFIDIAQALVKRCIHASSRICPSLCRRFRLDVLVVTTYGQMLTPLVSIQLGQFIPQTKVNCSFFSVDDLATSSMYYLCFGFYKTVDLVFHLVSLKTLQLLSLPPIHQPSSQGMPLDLLTHVAP